MALVTERNEAPPMWTYFHCRDEARARGVGRLRRELMSIPVGTDWLFRMGDFRVNRTYAGLCRWLGLDGHPPIELVLAAAMLFWIVMGPTGGMWRGAGAALLLAGAWALLAVVGCTLARAKRARNRAAEIQVATMAVACGVVWWLLGSDPSEDGATPYRHALLVIVPIMGAMILAARWLAKRLFRSLCQEYRKPFRQLLEHVEVHQTPHFVDQPWAAILRSIINGPLRYPMHLVFAPALVVLAMPFFLREYLRGIAIGMLIVTAVFLGLATLYPRLNTFVRLSTRALFLGGQGVVSLLIVVLAAGRLFEFGYIATLVESSSLGLVVSYLLAAYTVFWFYEYWTNAIVTERLLSLLQVPGDPVGQTSYALAPEVDAAEHVERGSRVLQVHGAARLIAIAPLKSHDYWRDGFHSYGRTDLIERLVEDGPPTVGTTSREKLREVVDEIRERVWFYFGILNVLLIALAIGAVWFMSSRWRDAELTVTAAPRAHVDLRQLLFEAPAGGTPRTQAILLAASGGGTRAALFATSLLHGLHDAGALPDLVLASGVSGGGASLAYFGGHRDELLRAGSEGKWRDYECVMSQPFIQDVLAGAAEWRIVTHAPFGQLLLESFERRFGFAGTGTSTVRDVGLIFNSSLAGRLQCPDCTPSTWHEYASANKRRARADVAGGRFIVTNLSSPLAFPGTPHQIEGHPDLRLTYEVVNENVPLVAAAALTANFPPVFPNAPVDVHSTSRIWVTDGGAVDNRGIESLLFALRDALEREVELRRNGVKRTGVPRLHVIVAEASASTIDYRTSDRGVGSALGAAAKVTNQLMVELIGQIGALCRQLGGSDSDLRLHYLEMPNTLRIRGGIGTHWMLPPLVKLTDPNDPDPRGAATLTIDSWTIRAKIDELHRAQPVEARACAGESRPWLAELFEHKSQADRDRMQAWIDHGRYRDKWRGVLAALGKAPQ